MISIIIPCYNAGSYLNACLDSIFAQDFKDYEVIAVNDGSKDDTSRILEFYLKEFTNLRVLNQENLGASAARNNALKVAKGDFIMFLDSDDLLEIGALKALYEGAKLGNNEFCDIMLGDYATFCGDKKSICKSYKFSAGILDHNVFFRSFCARESHFAVWGKLYKKAFLDEFNIRFLESVFVAEDVNFNAKAFLNARKIKKIDDVIVAYRIGENNASKDFKERHFMDAFACADDLEKYAKNDEINALCLRLKYEAMLNAVKNAPKIAQTGIYKAPFSAGFGLLSKRLKILFIARILLGNTIYQALFRILRKIK